MFGHDLPNTSQHIAQIKFAIGQGHPLIAWSGNTKTPDHEVINDISHNESAITYIKRLVAKGKIKVDEGGLYKVPAYLVLLEDETVTYEKPIEITVNPLSARDEILSPAAMFEKMFNMYSNALNHLTATSVTAVKDISIKAQEGFTATSVKCAEVLQTSAAECSKIVAAGNGTMEKQLGLIKEAYTHESTRADKACDAVIRMLNNKSEGKTDIIDDLVKIAGAAPILKAAIETFKKGN